MFRNILRKTNNHFLPMHKNGHRFAAPTTQLQLPIYVDNFQRAIDLQKKEKIHLVDKSLFIQEILDNPKVKVTHITRPKFFGRTFNLSMLHHFLAPEVNGVETCKLFDGLKISEYKQHMKHQGKYPVISITFKNLRANSFDAYLVNFRNLLGRLFVQHIELLKSKRLTNESINFFKSVLNSEIDETGIKVAISKLTEFIHLHYKVKPWILIDDYDFPIKFAYKHNFHEQMFKLMRPCLNYALKVNRHLERAVLIGVTKNSFMENSFSDVNSLALYTILDENYSSHFGFTEGEIIKVLQHAQMEDKHTGLKAYYGGYHIGNNVVYNPWSVACYIAERNKFESYWINTIGDKLIKEVLSTSTGDDLKGIAILERLIRGDEIELPINENAVYGDTIRNSASIWGLLLFSGHLTCKQINLQSRLMCKLCIPNNEVKLLYAGIIESWISNNGCSLKNYREAMNFLLNGDLDNFSILLNSILKPIANLHNIKKYPEVFSHILTLCLTSYLHSNKYYVLETSGGTDYFILSTREDFPSLLFEFKTVNNPNDLENETKQLMEQIEYNRCLVEFRQMGFSNIIKIAISFCGEKFHILHEKEQPKQKQILQR